MLGLEGESVEVVVDVASVVGGWESFRTAGKGTVAIGEEEVVVMVVIVVGEEGPTENHGQLQPIVTVVE